MRLLSLSYKRHTEKIAVFARIDGDALCWPASITFHWADWAFASV